MDERKTLKGLKVTMKKHPESLKLEGKLKDFLDTTEYSDSIIIYDGILYLYNLLFRNYTNF